MAAPLARLSRLLALLMESQDSLLARLVDKHLEVDVLLKLLTGSQELAAIALLTCVMLAHLLATHIALPWPWLLYFSPSIERKLS